MDTFDRQRRSDLKGGHSAIQALRESIDLESAGKYRGAQRRSKKSPRVQLRGAAERTENDSIVQANKSQLLRSIDENDEQLQRNKQLAKAQRGAGNKRKNTKTDARKGGKAENRSSNDDY